MIKEDLKRYIAAKMSVDFSDPQLDALVEAARMKVLSADGRHNWKNLTVKTTLALTANEDEYVFPPEGSDDPPFSNLVYIEGQEDEDAPIHVYSEEEAAHTNFTSEMTGVILRPHAEPGKVIFVFMDTPTTAETLNVVYRKVPGDDLDFVKAENHDVFLFACDLIIPVKGVSLESASAIRGQSYALYQDSLIAAIRNDYKADDEAGYFVPSPNVQAFMTNTITISENR